MLACLAAPNANSGASASLPHLCKGWALFPNAADVAITAAIELPHTRLLVGILRGFARTFSWLGEQPVRADTRGRRDHCNGPPDLASPDCGMRRSAATKSSRRR